MKITTIVYDTHFVKNFQKLSVDLQKRAILKEKTFKINPLHPSLRLHQLHGKLKDLWSISITKNYRIIFRRQDNGDIFFIYIGKHDLYKNI